MTAQPLRTQTATLHKLSFHAGADPRRDDTAALLLHEPAAASICMTTPTNKLDVREMMSFTAYLHMYGHGRCMKEALFVGFFLLLLASSLHTVSERHGSLIWSFGGTARSSLTPR